MIKRLLIKNAYAVLTDSVTERKVSVLVENGKICDIGDFDFSENAEVVDCNGSYLMPGFIDLHVHGGGGADFMDATVDSFKTVVEAHLKHGTTTLLPTSMTASEEDLTAFCKTFTEFKSTVHNGAKTPGLHFEGPYLSGAGGSSKGAQKGDYLRNPDILEAERLIAASDGNIIRWDIAPELPGALELSKKLSSMGIICSIAHSTADCDTSLKAFVSGFSHVTHCYNAVPTYRKVGQKVLDGVVEAAYLDDNAAIELICDGCHIPKGIVKLALKIKGADKVMAITDAMRIAGTDMKGGILGSLKSGTEVTVDDGVAKLLDLSSFAGSIATTDRCLRVLCRDYGIELTDASKMLSAAPAKLLKLYDTVGSIEVGKTADLVVTDSEFNVKNVILDGVVKA